MTNIPNIFLDAANKFTEMSESQRIQMYQDLKSFYENDYEQIETYIKTLLKGKGLYSESTLNKLIIRHRDNIQKVLKRLTAGIYENTPVREIGETEYDLPTYLDSINYNAKIKEIFRKAKYYGIAEMFVYWDGTKVRLEVLTPERYVVETAANDYLKKDKIYIQKSRYNNGQFELIYDVWTDNTYSILLSDGKLEKRLVGKSEVEIQPNIYGKIPVIPLRFNEGDYYFPEPNWDLFHSQIALDVKRTNNFYTELFQTFGIYVATNLNLKENEALSPNKILKVDNVKTEDVTPSLQFVAPNVNWDQLNGNIDFEVLDMLRSQGINTSSSSLDQKAQSGAAKTIDEIEVIEERESVKENLYRFEKELLEMIRIVQNNNSRSIPEGEFEIYYSEEKSIESIDDKVKRRDMEIKYNIKSPVDFIMEDFECSEEEAKEIYLDNKNEFHEGGDSSNSNDINESNDLNNSMDDSMDNTNF